MTFNASGQSFAPLNILGLNSPTALEGAGYNGLTSAQCAANGNLTSKAVTSSGVLVEAATVRTKGMTVIVPSDQPQVTFGNQSPLSGTTAANPIQAIPQIVTFAQQIADTQNAPSNNGFAVPPGVSVFLSPFNDAMYAITPTGSSATIYFIDTWEDAMSELFWPMFSEFRARLAKIEAHLGSSNPDWDKPDVEAPPDSTNPQPELDPGPDVAPEVDPDAAAIDKADLNDRPDDAWSALPSPLFS
jgi:hypothetical protein